MTTSQAAETKGWNQRQIDDWRAAVIAGGKRRDYAAIVSRLTALPANTHTLDHYATLTAGDDHYNLLCVTVGDLTNTDPILLITGGVHGYEPSGVDATIKFLERDAPRLAQHFNIVAYPCISPWAYEYDQRWNADAIDPNRVFSRSATIPSIDECHHLMTSIEQRGIRYAAAIDLHETPDRDIELRQMRSDRFGLPLDQNFRIIPQGFHLIVSEKEAAEDNEKQLRFGRSILNEVSAFSPIAPDATITNLPNRNGIILSPPKDGMLRNFLGKYTDHVGVTELYPDHPAMNPTRCVDAQIAAIHGAFKFIRS
jgi:hypothetical protein